MKTQHVGLAEVAEILGVSKQRASQIVKEPGEKFPAEVERLRMGPMWSRAEVEQWQKRQEGTR